MKSYVSDRQIRLVGKVWEVKRYLQQTLQQADRDLTLLDYVQAKQPRQLHKSLEKKQGPQIIPFPSS